MLSEPSSKIYSAVTWERFMQTSDIKDWKRLGTELRLSNLQLNNINITCSYNPNKCKIEILRIFGQVDPESTQSSVRLYQALFAMNRKNVIFKDDPDCYSGNKTVNNIQCRYLSSISKINRCSGHTKSHIILAVFLKTNN